MSESSALLLVDAVAAVSVLHTFAGVAADPRG
jgi:hypothetical protein